MKKISVLFLFFLLSLSAVVFAAGDLTVTGNATVNGTLNVGTVNVGDGGVKFPDGSTQTSAKRLVWDYTVTGSPVSSATNTTITLDGNADGGYEFEFIMNNPTAASGDYYLYYNDDTQSTHYFHGLFATNADLRNAAGAWIGALSSAETRVCHGNISITPSGLIMTTMNQVRTVSPYGVIFVHRYTVQVANLKKITIVGPTNGIGVDSRFRLWRRN